MSILTLEMEVPNAQDVRVTSDTLTVELRDGRSVAVPLEWFPRLIHANEKERNNWRIIGGGDGVHWEDVDEDISIEGLIAGRASGESQASLKKWLTSRLG